MDADKYSPVNSHINKSSSIYVPYFHCEFHIRPNLRLIVIEIVKFVQSATHEGEIYFIPPASSLSLTQNILTDVIQHVSKRGDYH